MIDDILMGTLISQPQSAVCHSPVREADTTSGLHSDQKARLQGVMGTPVAKAWKKHWSNVFPRTFIPALISVLQISPLGGKK